jgi:hypothetical protein
MRNITVLVKLLVFNFLLLGAVSVTQAAIIHFEATIDGAQANAGVGTGSPAAGFATMTLDDDSNLFSWDIEWSGLLGTETVMHFHGPAFPDQNAGVQVNFGLISGTDSPSTGSTTITNDQAADLLDGLWYINIHTDQFPDGEIRGQVQVVPIPAAFWLFGSGLAGLVGVCIRKQA